MLGGEQAVGAPPVRHAVLAQDLGPVEREVDGAPQPRIRVEERLPVFSARYTVPSPGRAKKRLRLTPCRAVRSDTSCAGRRQPDVLDVVESTGLHVGECRGDGAADRDDDGVGPDAPACRGRTGYGGGRPRVRACATRPCRGREPGTRSAPIGSGGRSSGTGHVHEEARRETRSPTARRSLIVMPRRATRRTTSEVKTAQGGPHLGAADTLDRGGEARRRDRCAVAEAEAGTNREGMRARLPRRADSWTRPAAARRRRAPRTASSTSRRRSVRRRGRGEAGVERVDGVLAADDPQHARLGSGSERPRPPLRRARRARR